MATAVRERAKVKSEAGFDELYRQLNAEQQRAVDEIEGPVMVLAGPGTGKTQVLAMRVANILRRTQMNPGNILCLTFTESAAVAMRQRLIKIMGEAAYYVRISTFHSFCNDVIQEWPEKFAQIKGKWQVLSDIERVELFQKLLDRLPGASALKPFGNPHLFLRDVIENVRKLKQEGVSEDEFKKILEKVEKFVVGADKILADFFAVKADERTDEMCDNVYRQLNWGPLRQKYEEYVVLRKEAGGKREQGRARTKLKNDWKRIFDGMKKQLPKQKDLLKVYRDYERELKKRGRYDYEDMVMRVVEKFRDDEGLLAHYQEQYQYILVDEYQDTNGAQNEVVSLLGNFYPSANIFVVGDDKQSIFRFQGASLENLLAFYEQYRKDVKVITLKNNYRSQQTVLDAADRVIVNNKGLVAGYVPGVTTELEAVSGRQSVLLERLEFDTEDEEAYGVAWKIKALVDQGVEPDEIAVLYRFNKDAADLMNVMLRMEIPVRLEVGEDVLKDVKIRQLLELLTYLADEQRDEVLADILQYDFWQLEALDVLKVLYYTGSRRRLLTVISRDDLLQEAGVKDTGPFKELTKKLAQWRMVEKNHTLQYFFDVVLNESGWWDYVLKSDDKLPLLDKVSTVFDEIKKISSGNGPLGVKDFVARMDVLADNDMALAAQPWQTKKRSVRLMTVHKAKGLEFEHVFIIKLVDHHWGNVRDRNRVSLPAGIIKFDPIQGQEGNEDERRLFYVALTRARLQAYLTSARYGSSGRELVPSIFVREVGDEHMKKIDTSELEEEAVERLKIMHLSPLELSNNGDIKEWLAERLKNYTMSVTHLNNYLECPRLFYYRNLLHVPAAKTKHMAFGTAVHGALKDLFLKLNEDGRLPGEKYLIDRFVYYLGFEDLTRRERSDSVQFGKEILKNYYRFYAKSFKTKALVEYDFRSHGVHFEDLILTGKVDKAEVLNEKKVNVVDYKTGNPDNAGKHLREEGNYRRQIVFYKLLGDLSPKFGYEVVSGEIDFVQPSKRTGKLVKKKFIIGGDETDELKEMIRKVWKEIKELKFLEGKGCGKCDYCK
ncbi:MAG: ATP-dependent DNA helicase [bacterium]